MYSLVIKIAILVNKAVPDEITKLTLGFEIDNVELVIILPDPIKISVIITNLCFFQSFIILLILIIIIFKRF